MVQSLLLFHSGLGTGSGGVTEISYRSTDSVRQNTSLTQFFKTNQTIKPDNRNQYENNIAKNLTENDFKSS